MPESLAPLVVIAAYRFVDIGDAAALRQRLEAAALQAGLRGTVLIAPEGINLALAGAPPALQGWLDGLRADPRFAAIAVHSQPAAQMPFQRLRVRCKAEIIRMNQPAVRPQVQRAATVDAATLARWLDAGRCDDGRPLALLDTRNAFEVDAGAFDAAIDWRLHRFSDFPAALQAHAADLAGKTVVSYCTGGIRCEKAALWLAQTGVPHVLQLDGGILGYFDALAAPGRGAPHWRGRCVVFDQRGALEPDRAEAGI